MTNETPKETGAAKVGFCDDCDQYHDVGSPCLDPGWAARMVAALNRFGEKYGGSVVPFSELKPIFDKELRRTKQKERDRIRESVIVLTRSVNKTILDSDLKHPREALDHVAILSNLVLDSLDD